VPLSLAWDPHRQALTGFRATPRPLELQLYAAAEAGDLTGVQALLAAGARVDVKGEGGWDALMHAASAGKPAIVRALLAHGANANTREDKAGFRTLPLAPKLEVTTPAAVQVTGRTALINAAVRGHTDVVRELLAAGADPGWRDVSGRTARDWAEWAHRTDVVLLLQRAQAGR
jgi:ankyrin repeat protein